MGVALKALTLSDFINPQFDEEQCVKIFVAECRTFPVDMLDEKKTE